jgi:hypothetical protein
VSSTIDTATISNTSVSLQNSTITDCEISGGTINATAISAGSISGTDIEGGTVNATAISAGSISGTDIEGGTVNATAVTSTSFTDITISGGTISTASITSGTIADAAISNTSIETGTINAASITSGTIADASISNTTISTGSITSTDIEAGTINATSISSGSVITNADITGGTITHSKFIEKKVAATSGTGTKAYNLNDGSSFEHTASGAFTANFTNVPGTHTTSWTLEVVNGGTAHTITWQVAGADALNWSEGVVPPPSTGTDIYSFISVEGTVYGSLAIRNGS